MILATLAAVIVALALVVIYDRGYATCARRYESTYREALRTAREKEARQRGEEALLGPRWPTSPPTRRVS